MGPYVQSYSLVYDLLSSLTFAFCVLQISEAEVMFFFLLLLSFYMNINKLLVIPVQNKNNSVLLVA